MFTFGRENEIRHAIDFVGDAEKAALLIETIDAVHDFLEHKISHQQAKDVISKAISEGKGGVWESAGSWLRKLSGENPEFVDLWEALATHKSSKVRVRVAAHINELPVNIFPKICETLINDKSASVRSKVAGDLYFSKHPDALAILSRQRHKEENEDVLETIIFAIEGIEQRA